MMHKQGRYDTTTPPGSAKLGERLSEYVNNVLKEEGLEPKKKLTFDEWFKDYGFRNQLAYAARDYLRIAWEVGQENV